MSAKVIGSLMIALGVGAIALAVADFLGWPIGLDGSSPALAIGAVLIGLGWLKLGEKAAAERRAATEKK